MLQIIGWMGCFYLFLKGIEYLNSRAFMNDEGQITPSGIAAGILALLGAFGFFFLLDAQVSESGLRELTLSEGSNSNSYLDGDAGEAEREAARIEAEADRILKEIEDELARD